MDKYQLITQSTKGGLYNVAKKIVKIYGPISTKVQFNSTVTTHYDRDLLRIFFRKLLPFNNIKGVHFIHCNPIILSTNKKFINTFFILILYKLMSKMNWKFIAISSENYAFFKKLLNIKLIYNPILIDDKIFKRKIDNNLIKLVNMSRFEMQKNHLEGILEFLKFEKNTKTPLTLDIYGDGPTKQSIKSFLEKNCINNIKLHDWSDNVEEDLNNYDVYYQYSLFEGLPTIVVQSIKLGLIPITLPIASGNELFKSNQIVLEGFKIDLILQDDYEILLKNYLIKNSINKHEKFFKRNFVSSL